MYRSIGCGVSFDGAQPAGSGSVVGQAKSLIRATLGQCSQNGAQQSTPCGLSHVADRPASKVVVSPEINQPASGPPTRGSRPNILHRSSVVPYTGVPEHTLARLVEGYRTSGGLATAGEVLQRMRTEFEQPVSLLARWIVGRHVLAVVWQAEHLLQLFQFGPVSMVPRRSARAVIDELASVFDDWELALWFAQPNSWLKGRRPADVIAYEPASVLDAGRADRFVATG